MNLYFGNAVTTISTLLVLATLTLISITIFQHSRVEKWGRKTAALASIGLLVCIFVAARDQYHLSVQASIDGFTSPGLFSIDGIQSTLCCIGGAVIAFTTISSIFIKNQKYRKVMFFILSLVITLKTFIIETSRWWM